jgi:hypothetical protein
MSAVTQRRASGPMRAIVLDGPGPPSALAIRERPIPVPGPRSGVVLTPVAKALQPARPARLA